MTFAHSISGSGVAAIVAGVVAGVVRDNFGPVAPFDVSLVCLVLGSTIVYSTWGENTGDVRIDLSTTVSNAWERIVSQASVAVGMHPVLL